MSGAIDTQPRYRVTSVLGHGGTGEVAEAVDSVTGRTVAVKSLLLGESLDHESRAVRLFEQEFHTLSQLRHPRVIEVYDFHREAERVYYTMELLDGGDLRELSPLPWQRACAVLCDVCSALSLLHSRRLVHRDLSTRNVRCTKDGKAKLIDFGAMTQFGTSKHIVGTPAFVAPEVLTGQVLDGRTDLFSLGATAYYALTGHHAFPAPTLNAQRNAWRSRPQPPSRFVPDVPRELDELVMSLLQLAPVARPRSAAEVMERLCAIGGVPLEEPLLVRQAYLATPTLVGRDEPLLRVRKQLLRATRGRGGAFIITGPSGVGRSRFLDACVLEGKLLGTLVLRADRGDGVRPWGGVRALLRQLHDLAPDLPRFAMQFADGEADGDSSAGGESRSVLQARLCRHLLDAAFGRGLMLAIDDIDGLDEPSTALVALLAEASSRHAVSVMATAPADAEQSGGTALALLSRVSSTIALEGLGPAQTLLLLLSVFGDVPNIRLLADRLYAISGGSPRAVMQLAQHMLDRELVRFQAGAWTLPDDIDATDLPTSLSDALGARVAALDPQARLLAQGLALSGRSSLTLLECIAIAEAETDSVLRALDDLVTASVFDVDVDTYAFSQPAIGPVLLRTIDPAERSKLHRRLARLFEDAGESFLALQHEFWAGREEVALDALLEVIAEEGDRASESIGALLSGIQQRTPPQWREVMEGLLVACERLQRPREQAIRLRLSLILRAIAFSEECSEEFTVLLDELRRDSGVDICDRLDPALPAAERLETALSQLQQQFDRSEPKLRGLPPRVAITYLRTASNVAVSIAGRSFDYSFLERVPSLAVFAPLSVYHELADIHVRTGAHVCAGRMERAREGYLELLRRYREVKGVAAAARGHMGYTNAIGLIEAGIGLPSAEERAAALENDPAFALNAWNIRMLHALRQGDFEGAESHARRIELLRVQSAPPAIYEGSSFWTELRSYAAAEDLGRLKQLMPKIEGMARRFPSWMPFLQYARGCYHLLRRGPEGALFEFDRGLALGGPGRHPAWAALAGGCITALHEMGREQEAVERGRMHLASAREAELGYQAGFIERALALAESAIGEHERAIDLAMASIDLLEALGAAGLDLGISYEARARVAITMKDQELFERFARRSAAQYRAGHNPVLTVKYERLLDHARRAGLEVPQHLARAGVGPGPQAGPAATKAFAALETADGPDARAHAALRCLIDESASAGGFLYTMQQDGPVVAAALCDRDPPSDMDGLVNAYLSAELDSTHTVTVSTATESATQSGCMETWPGGSGDSFAPFLLSHVTRTGYMVTGLAVLCGGSKGAIVPPAEMLPVLSQALADAGDVVAQTGAS